jgi:drug/metabolite transporter (DMT)-like permease
VPLAEATAVSFTSPFIVAVLAGWVLGERVGHVHWLAIALGFVGALMVIRPGMGAIDPYLFLVVGNAACYAGYQVLTRRVAAYDRPETSVSYDALIGTVLLSAVVPFF